MNRRVLFVDDDPSVLAGLRRMLRPMRDEWEMEFVGSGAEALESIDRAPSDVVVTDMRMPGMSGAELLDEVRRRRPETVRIVLSGQSDRESTLRSLGPTHQYLSKPCDSEMLKRTVGRACRLRDLLRDPVLKSLVSGMDSLPSLPARCVELMDLIQSPDASAAKVGDVIAQDMGMTTKILQLVNSAFFGIPRHVSSPAQAVGLLGLETVKALVLSVQVFTQFQGAARSGLALESLWTHSGATGALAKGIAGKESCPRDEIDEAFLAGLLHDVGKLVIAVNLPDKHREVTELAKTDAVPLHSAEMVILGSTHAEVGAYLLGLWGLSDPIVEAVAFHHRPAESAAPEFRPLTAVHVADALEYEAVGAATANPQVDTEHLTMIGRAERLPEWRALAGKTLQRSEAA